MRSNHCASPYKQIEMHPCGIQLDDIQALVFLKAVIELLLRETLSRDHVLDQLQLDPRRS